MAPAKACAGDPSLHVGCTRKQAGDVLQDRMAQGVHTGGVGNRVSGRDLRGCETECHTHLDGAPRLRGLRGSRMGE